MTQEIKVNITLTIEGDASQDKNEIRDFVDEVLKTDRVSKLFSIYKYRVNGIHKEAEIYAPDTHKSEGIWEFVERYYPNYYSCNEIMRNDDLCKIVNGELNGDAERLFSEEFGNDLELARAAFDQSSKYVYERAIVGYQRSQQGTISIVWGLQDIEGRAKDNGYILEDGQAQQVLDMLKDKHDCNIGITWDVIDDYLSYIVPDSVEDEGFVWEPIQFQGNEYMCRCIAGKKPHNFEILVAPVELSFAMNLSENGEGTIGAKLLDEKIAYYANERQLKLSDQELLVEING